MKISSCSCKDPQILVRIITHARGYMSENIKKIESPLAPKAIGPYSQAIMVAANQRLIFVSGQLPTDPITGDLIQGNIQVLTKRVIQNIEVILKEAGSCLKNVVRTDIFLKDLKNDFSGMNEEYAKHFCITTPPARQTVQVSELPKGASIEISCIAVVD